MEPISRRQFLGGPPSVVPGSSGPRRSDSTSRYATEVKRALRIEGATVSHSVCPYCATGCALLAYTKEHDGHAELLQIEGNPDSPVNEGCLCPKGATSLQPGDGQGSAHGPACTASRAPSSGKRSPGTSRWTRWPRNIKDVARPHLRHQGRDGNTVNRCEGIGFAGGAAFSNEEGYLSTKVLRALGVVYVDQQART